MACNKNYNFKVDLSNIPLKNNCYDWANSIGCIIPFTSDIINGNLVIERHLPKAKNGNSHIILSYNNKNLSEITINCLKQGRLGGILKDYLPYWKFKINDRILDDKRDITIIDRKVIDGIKKYKILCNKCTFDSGEHFSIVNNIFMNEYWILESQLKNGSGCPCCSVAPKIVVKGINDISTTDPWMVEYFKDKEKACMYTCWSSKKEEMICKDCGKEKRHKISDLKKCGYMSCECNDNISMPNKIAYYSIKDIKNITNYQREYSPKWLKPYRYDNYFEYNHKQYVIEMDGAVGHGHNKYKSLEPDVDGLVRDNIKDERSKNHNVIVYRVDCTSGDNHIIFNNLFSTLKEIMTDELILNEYEILRNSTKNIIKEVCDYYMNVNNSFKIISKRFHINVGTVGRYLEQGREFGWCTYIKQSDQKIINKNIAIDLYNKNMSIKKISEKLNLHYDTIRNYILEASKDGLCNYNPEYESKIGRELGIQHMVESISKRVFVYDCDYNYISTYKSVMDLERNSLNDLGTELKSRCVGRVCLGQRKHYKGYIFSYKPLNHESQNDSLLLCSNE